MHCNLGEAYRALGRFDEAIAEYQRAIALAPDLAAAYSNKGLALQQQYDDVVEMLGWLDPSLVQLNQVASRFGNVLKREFCNDLKSVLGPHFPKAVEKAATQI